jgi:hypothetical protein
MSGPWTAGLAGQETPSRWESLLQRAHTLAEAGDSAQAEQTYQAALAERLSADEPLGLSARWSKTWRGSIAPRTGSLT